MLKDSLILDYSENSTLVSDMNKDMIRKYFKLAPLNFRIKCMEELMDTYKLASNPYLEGVREGVHYASHRRVEATGNVMCGVLGNYAGIIGAANLVAKKAYLLD